MKNHIPTFENFINEAKDFKSTRDFEEFLEEIDGMPEVRIKRIMGNKYIDTPGGYRDEAEDYDNDIVEYMIANMGKKELEKLKAYWETNVKESVNESMSDIDIIAQESKDFKDFIKRFKKEYPDVAKVGTPKELEEFLQAVFDNSSRN